MSKENHPDKKEILRHSTAHVLAAAVLEMFPEAKFGMGPATSDGFYYDFDLPRTLIPEDLEILEEKMQALIKQNLPFEKKQISVEEALDHFQKAGQDLKVEIIKDLEGEGEENVMVYKTGSFVDLCHGPHLESTGEIDAQSFKLTKISGAYWKGDENQQMLQRIYGVVFANKKELKQYLHQIEEAKKRDHRKLGKELDLFCFSDLVGPGLPMFTPKGTAIKRVLQRWIEDEEIKRGYQHTWTPDISRVALFEKSGHWQHYQDDMYPAMEIYDDQLVLRPMTCPHQFMVYNSRPRSYRELPIKYAEISKLYRREKSGELFGLMRHAGGWSFADAHIICTSDQMEEEFEKVVNFVQHVMKTLGITEYWYRFSKWDPNDKKGKYVDDPEAWEISQASMKKILEKLKLDYVEAEGEAAFYGPKLDIQLQNVNGKDETAFTVQIDLALPEKFDMTYIDKDGEEKRPIAIHHSSIGCFERIIAFLIEKYAGAFPVWLSPVQATILPVSEKFNGYAKNVNERLLDAGIRSEVNDSDDSLGKKIAETTKQKVPYILVVGEKEEKDESVAVRERGSNKKPAEAKAGKQNVMKVDEFVEKIIKEIEDRKI